ncbi:hypothetical protein E3A20_22980, partial [Planctomyces bekefii]
RATAEGDEEQVGNLSGLDGRLKLRSSSQNVQHANRFSYDVLEINRAATADY